MYSDSLPPIRHPTNNTKAKNTILLSIEDTQTHSSNFKLQTSHAFLIIWIKVQVVSEICRPQYSDLNDEKVSISLPFFISLTLTLSKTHSLPLTHLSRKRHDDYTISCLRSDEACNGGCQTQSHLILFGCSYPFLAPLKMTVLLLYRQFRSHLRVVR